ncbi:PASTA domain-containing protein [Streptomyces bicolor]|uniref:PASTA domain-containing protein n=1 Tax=Streptomyces bicolor TaxID=66874 RepID=UPI0004E1F366|nr:PASTA domain-containing protein [Streptomyces bicolor]
MINGPPDTPSAEDTTSPLLSPDVRGMTVEDAQQLLQSQGLQTGTTEHVSDAATPGTVIDQIPPPGEPAAPGSTVTLVVASATDPSTEPTLPPEPTETPLITGPPDESTATPGAAASNFFDGTTSD